MKLPKSTVRDELKFLFLHKFLLTLCFKNISICTSIRTKATGFLTKLSFKNYVCGQSVVRPYDPIFDLENAAAVIVGIITWFLVF